MLKTSVIASVLFLLTFANRIDANPRLEDSLYEKYQELPQSWIKPGAFQRESIEEKNARIKMITRIIVSETRDSLFKGWSWSDSDLAWAVFVKTWAESGRFQYEVHAGLKRGDHGKSVCLGQIMHGGNSLVGTSEDKTRNCIRAVIKHLVLHQRRCLNETTQPSVWAMTKIYSGYATGYSCSARLRLTQSRALIWWKAR